MEEKLTTKPFFFLLSLEKARNGENREFPGNTNPRNFPGILTSGISLVVTALGKYQERGISRNFPGRVGCCCAVAG